MKIKSISWENYRGLSDGQIIADGSDVLISGRNGTGKSSIASVLPFVLYGADAAKIKHYEDGIIPTDDGLIHSAEVVFDSGIALRREYFWSKQGNRQKFFVNGSEVKVKEFDAKVENLTFGGGKLICNPFTFCELKRNEQRDMLMKFFGQTSTLTDNEVENILDGNSPDIFIATTKRTIDALKKDAVGIEPAIRELQLQIADAPENLSVEIDSLKKKISDAKIERSLTFEIEPSKATQKISAEIAILRHEREEIQETAPPDLTKQIATVQWSLDRLQQQISDAENSRNELLKEYFRVKKSAAGTCPTCGQKIPLEQFNSKRDKQLADITARGEKIRDGIAESKKILADTAIRLENLKSQAAKFSGTPEKISQIDAQIAELNNQLQVATLQDKSLRDAQIDAIDDKISAFRERLVALESAIKIQARIVSLQNRELDINKKITLLEHQIATVKNFLHKKIEFVEDKINANFRHVKFKLFDFFITTGEVKPTCEPTLNGVPYSSLSKGERLKAALDIFLSLQNHFGVELPLFIDDAESYTLNSFLELPNQKFLFRVDECNLAIKVGIEK